MSDLARYVRQTTLPEVGADGQERLLASSVVVIGGGGLGSTLTSTLVRAGVGRVRIVDRDTLELNNLQRQITFDEDDVGRPKAIAAADKLRRINSQVEIEPIVVDVRPGNVEHLIAGVDLVLDGADNFETRFLVNDACVKHNIPWVYGAVVATYGMVRAILPHFTPCLRCFLPEMPAPGSTPTCATVGILATAVSAVASLEATEGLKILLGREQDLHPQLLYVDVWAGVLDKLEVGKRAGACPACELGRFDFLAASGGGCNLQSAICNL